MFEMGQLVVVFLSEQHLNEGKENIMEVYPIEIRREGNGIDFLALLTDIIRNSYHVQVVLQ